MSILRFCLLFSDIVDYIKLFVRIVRHLCTWYNIHDILLKFSQDVKNVLGDKLTKIILYGSYARGEQHKGSDIDIMVLTTLTDAEIEKIEEQIFDIAFDYEMDYFIELSVIIKNEEHFNYWLGHCHSMIM